jgi:hypothetical protein
MSREFVARDPRTGRPIFSGKEVSSRKKIKIESGPYQVLPPQVVIPLATGQIESYRVSYMEEYHHLGQLDGIRALSNLSGALAHQGHAILLESLISQQDEVRIAALTALPSMAETCPDELFDHLSVLLDDEVLIVAKAASRCLANVAPVFPSATEGTLAYEIRHKNSYRRNEALKGLKGLCKTWPEVACVHIDELLQEDDLPLRRAAAGMLRSLLHRGRAAAWDLIGWALEDEDVETRRKASTCLVTLANKEPRIATILAEKAILDPDSTVMLSAIRCIEALDTDHGRARELVITGCSHKNPNVRLACVKILPRLMGDEILRNHCESLMRDEKDPRVLAELEKLTFDAQMEGTEAQKNAYLAPAPSVPQIDREVAESQGKTIGLEDLPPPVVKGEDIRHG